MADSLGLGTPPFAQRNRALVEQRLRDVGDGPQETVTVEFRGAPVHLPVITVPVGELHYNPGTHRVRAQRAHRRDADATLAMAPWSSAAQQYLHELLRCLPIDPGVIDPAYVAMKNDLKEHGQTSPGVATRDLVLVNGNTRRAALLDEYGIAHPMRVAVLPPSATWDDVADVEMSLQLRAVHERGYSYINRLLAVEELAARGVDDRGIASRFHSTEGRVSEDRWVLSTVREMIGRSDVDDARPLTLFSFEERKEKFRELHRAYAKASPVHREQAEVMRECRLAAIMAGFPKTDVRLIEHDFLDRYLMPQVEYHDPDGDLTAGVGESAPVAIPGLGRTVDGASRELATARHLTDIVLTGLNVDLGDTSGRLARYLLLRGAINEALVSAGRNYRGHKKKNAASMRLGKAAGEMKEAITDLTLARGYRDGVDPDVLNDAVGDLLESMDTLARELRRTVPDGGGDHIERWLSLFAPNTLP